MKSSYPLAIMCMLCTGCATYQYATVSSSLKGANSEIFAVENDTAKIMYDFSGEQGPVKISVYNKLQVPLYIDWNKSALIVSNVRKSYANKNSSLDAELNGTETRWMNSTTQNATIKGTITGGEVSGFIPPKAWARECQLSLSPEFFLLPAPATKEDKKRVNGIIVKSFSYSQEQSPFTFRSFLTLSTQADLSSPIHFDDEFWVSEISQTSSGPKNFTTQPDIFYIKKSTGNPEILVVAGAVGVAGIMFLTMQDQSKKALD